MQARLTTKKYLKTINKRTVTKNMSYLFIVLSLIFFNGCNFNKKKNVEEKTSTVLNTLTETEKEQGWILLFDGTTFNGWRGLGLDKVPEGWVIEDGAIKIVPKSEGPRQADGQPLMGYDLISEKTWGNFELRWEWKLDHEGNSGIKYNVSEELSLEHPPLNAALGWEYQMVDDESMNVDANPTHSAGALYDMIVPAGDKTVKPIGQYNTSRIIFNGNHGEHWLNGKKVLEYEMGTEHFDSLFMKSKYKDIQSFADKKKGHVVLQDHAESAWFRNIKIKPLE